MQIELKRKIKQLFDVLYVELYERIEEITLKLKEITLKAAST